MGTVRSLLVMLSIGIMTSCATLGLQSARSAFDEGIAYFNRGDFEEAIALFQKAIELDPEYGEAYLYLGRSYLSLGRWFDAITPLRTAFRIAPAETKREAVNLLLDALLAAGADALKRGDFKSSIGLFKEALELKPESHEVKTQLLGAVMGFGTQSLSEGNPTEAINAFTEALQLSPNNIDAYLSLAKAFFNNGDFFKALQTVQNLLSLDPGNEAARSLMNQLMAR
jgi:tetratricopeptide (TPR) repeat protein